MKRVAWSLLAALVLGVCAVGVLGWQQGYRLYAVRTGSMAPTFPTGALLVDAPAASAPAVGDVVTFRTQDGLVTHRVHGLSPAGLSTKGDANRTPDAWTVPADKVVGHVVVGVPRAGYLLVFLRQPTGVPSLMLLLVSSLLAWSFFFPGHQPPRPQHAHRTHGWLRSVAQASGIKRFARPTARSAG